MNVGRRKRRQKEQEHLVYLLVFSLTKNRETSYCLCKDFGINYSIGTDVLVPKRDETNSAGRGNIVSYSSSVAESFIGLRTILLPEPILPSDY